MTKRIEKKVVVFWLPEVRTLADMTPAERVKLSGEIGAPFLEYDALGRAKPCTCRKKFRSKPCVYHGDRCDGVFDADHGKRCAECKE